MHAGVPLLPVKLLSNLSFSGDFVKSITTEQTQTHTIYTNTACRLAQHSSLETKGFLYHSAGNGRAIRMMPLLRQPPGKLFHGRGFVKWSNYESLENTVYCSALANLLRECKLDRAAGCAQKCKPRFCFVFSPYICWLIWGDSNFFIIHMGL